MKYSDLVVWQKSMDLVTEVYKFANNFPSDERFGLCSQIRRAAVSVPSNIAEGHGRKATGAYINHLSIAHGSLMELETQIQIALRLEFVEPSAALALIAQSNEIGRMLNALKNSLTKQAE